MPTIELHITGMSCGACQKHVTQTLLGARGVQSAEVDLQSGLARVQGAVDPVALIEAVEEEGYRAHLTTVAGSADAA